MTPEERASKLTDKWLISCKYNDAYLGAETSVDDLNLRIAEALREKDELIAELKNALDDLFDHDCEDGVSLNTIICVRQALAKVKALEGKS